VGVAGIAEPAGGDQPLPRVLPQCLQQQ
jgi:hypothetical protein